LTGKTLAQKISASGGGEIDLKESIDIMIQVYDALRKMHSKNIIHRDLKPENIMLINKNGNPNFVKLLDFGLAMTEYQSRLTRTGAIIGTISYISPEQIGQSEFSPARIVGAGSCMLTFFKILKKPRLILFCRNYSSHHSASVYFFFSKDLIILLTEP